MKRYIFAMIGVFFVALGAIGIWLPLIPTVGPLLLASFFFAKSFPALEKRLIRNRLFAKFLRFIDGDEIMSNRQRLGSIGIMWISITLSGVAIWFGASSPIWILAILLTLGLIGTVFIWRFRRSSSLPENSSLEQQTDEPVV